MELGREMREELRANRLLVEEGHAIRAQYIAQGKAAKQEQHNKLTSLGPKRDELQRMKDDLQVQSTPQYNTLRLEYCILLARVSIKPD